MPESDAFSSASRTSSILFGRMMHLISFIFVVTPVACEFYSTLGAFMSEPCTVIIGAPQLLDAFRERAGGEGEVLDLQRSRRAESARADHDRGGRQSSRSSGCLPPRRAAPRSSTGSKKIPALRVTPRFASCRMTARTRASRRGVPAEPKAAAPQTGGDRRGTCSACRVDWTTAARAARRVTG